MQLQSNPVDRNATPLEILHHRLDPVGLPTHSFALGLVMEEQCLRIGFTRPVKGLRNIRSALSCEPYTGWLCLMESFTSPFSFNASLTKPARHIAATRL